MADSNKIGKYELTALIVGATIGSGIFGVNSDLANAAAPGPAILGWLIVGLGVWCLIAALNHLLLRYPKQDAEFCVRGAFVWAAGRVYFRLGIAGWLHGWATSPLPRLR